jgi:hypothetical protein
MASPLVSSLLNGRDNPRVRSTAADVSIHVLANILFRGVGNAIEQSDSGDDHPGGAVSALEGFAIEKRLLHRMQATVLLETLDGSDFFIRSGGHLSSAGPHWPAIQQHRTGAALTLATSVFCASQVQFVAQYGQKTAFARHVYTVFGPVYLQHESHEPPRTEKL